MATVAEQSHWTRTLNAPGVRGTYRAGHNSISARCDGRRRDVNVRPHAFREHALPMMRELNVGDKLDHPPQSRRVDRESLLRVAVIGVFGGWLDDARRP